MIIGNLAFILSKSIKSEVDNLATFWTQKIHNLAHLAFNLAFYSKGGPWTELLSKVLPLAQRQLRKQQQAKVLNIKNKSLLFLWITIRKSSINWSKALTVIEYFGLLLLSNLTTVICFTVKYYHEKKWLCCFVPCK